jgi:hypothetical protein
MESARLTLLSERRTAYRFGLSGRLGLITAGGIAETGGIGASGCLGLMTDDRLAGMDRNLTIP